MTLTCVNVRWWRYPDWGETGAHVKEVFVPLCHHLYSRASSDPLNSLPGCDGTEGIEDVEESESTRFERDGEPPVDRSLP